MSTCYVLQLLLGVAKVKYSPAVHLGFVSPSTRDDVRQIPHRTPSRSFDRSFRIFRRTTLVLNRVDDPGTGRAS